MDASQIAKLPNPDLKKILLHLYGYQTPEEQMTEGTIELNDIGFNGVDAEILSSFAEQVRGGRELSEKQYNILRLRLPKYHRQVNGSHWDAIELPEVKYTNGAKKDYSQVKVVWEGSKAQHDFAKVSAPTLLDKKYAGKLSVDPDNGGLMFTPNVYPSKQIKSIGFSNWKNGAWHQFIVKLSKSVVDDVQRLFGEIEIDPEVLEAIKPAPLPDLPDWVTELFPTLHPFQLEAIREVMTRKRLLLALAPRLGKSVVSVLAVDALQLQRVLVVAPLSILKDWKNKILRWSPFTDGADIAIVYKKNVVVPARWTITNYDTVRLHPDTFNRTKWDAIIVDESLLVKNRKAKRTESISDLLRDTKPSYSWLLSGAPSSRLYTDLWAQLNILDAKQFSSYWKFADKYCVVEPSQWSKYNVVANKPDAAQRLQADLSHIFYTRSHADVTDMPPLEPENLNVAMGNSQDKMYGQMEYDFLAELPDEEKLVAPNVLAQLTRLIQIASNPLLVGGRDDSPKWDALVEMLDYEDGPIIVWTSFIETVKRLQERLAAKSRPIAILTGATKQEERGNITEAFQQGRVDVLIAHPAVGKYGLDLFNARSVIYLERGHNADDYYQSLMRVRHIDQKVSPHIVHLLSERKDGSPTMDHVVDQILSSRTMDTKKLTTANIRKMMGV